MTNVLDRMQKSNRQKSMSGEKNSEGNFQGSWCKNFYSPAGWIRICLGWRVVYAKTI